MKKVRYPGGKHRELDSVQQENTSNLTNSPDVLSSKRGRAQEHDSNDTGSPVVQKRTHPRTGLSVRRAIELRPEEGLAKEAITPVGDFQLVATMYGPVQRVTIQEPQQEGQFDQEDLENLLALGASPSAAPEFFPVVQPMEVDELPNIVDAEVEQVHLVEQIQLEVKQIHLAVQIQRQVIPGPVVEVLHFNTYQNRDIECPVFLNADAKNIHKRLFEQLHLDGARFLTTNQRAVRHWSNYPSHEKTFIIPMAETRHQIYFPRSPKDIVYKGTWVSAVVKDVNNQIYPVHIITKNTLGAVSNMIAYPLRIANLFSSDDFITHWPHGLGKECLIICVDTPEQRRQLFRDYEALVLREAQNAQRKVPNCRVYCKGELSDMKTVEGCKQRSLFSMAKPNMVPYTEERLRQLQFEAGVIADQRDAIPEADFENACERFFNPQPLSHELALTHFSITQLQRYCGALTQSRQRMINLKGKLCAQYQGPQMRDADLQQFMGLMNNSIADRTRILTQLNELIEQYHTYSRRLSDLFNFGPQPDIHQVENIIYRTIQNLLHDRGIEEAAIQAQFPSGKALITWMLTKRITVPAQHSETLIDEMLEHLSRPEVQPLRVY